MLIGLLDREPDLGRLRGERCLQPAEFDLRGLEFGDGGGLSGADASPEVEFPIDLESVYDLERGVFYSVRVSIDGAGSGHQLHYRAQ